MEAKRHDSRHLLRQLMDNIGDNIFFKDREHNFIMINQANAHWFGLKDPDEAIGKSDFDFFDADYAQRELEDEKRIMETGEPLAGHVESTTYHGFTAWGSVTKVPMRDEQGEICGIMGIGRDITPLKLKEIQLKEAHQEMAEDLRVAATLQKTFLPSDYPVFLSADGKPRVEFHHFYEASSQLGGDFCSIHKLSGSTVGLFICDVMGHGVRSALITAGIKAIVDALCKRGFGAADFLTEMNRRLFPLMRSGDNLIFATACYAILDVDTLELDLAVAGHSPPVLLSAAPGVVEQVQLPSGVLGPALALMEDVSYQGHRLSLKPEDALIMFTDGIIEASDADEEEFGVEGLLKVLRGLSTADLKETIAAILNQSREFSEAKRFADDVCLVGFSVHSEPGDA